MDTIPPIQEADRPEIIPDALVRLPGGHVSSIEQLRAMGDVARRSLGRAPEGAIPVIGNGADRVDARPRPKIR